LLVAAFHSLPRYSITWDEALGDLFFGERYFSFFSSFDPTYLDFRRDVYPVGRVPDLSATPFRGEPRLFYPVANTLAAGTSALLSRRLRLLDPFDGFHALNLFLGAILVVAVHRFVVPLFGRAAAAASVIALFLCPRTVADLFANIKDFPEMVFFSLAAMAFATGLDSGSQRTVAGAGILWGLALGTKANALFLPIIPALTLLGGVPDPWRGRRRAILLSGFAAFLLGLAVWLMSWPWLWTDPVGRLSRHLSYFILRGTGGGVTAAHTEPALEALVLTTPVPFLALFAFGMPETVTRARRELRPRILLVWIGVVVARLLVPGALNFDGVRHFLEIFPPMAIVVGAGLSRLAGAAAEQAHRALSASAAPFLAATLAFVLPLGAMAASLAGAHPFETAYWNFLGGGLAGARQRGTAQAGDYYAASYRVGLRWLDANAPPGSFVAVPIAEHVVRLTAPLWLRPDIHLVHTTEPVSGRVSPESLRQLARLSRRQAVFVLFARRSDWMNELTDECIARLRPEVEWKRDGEAVLEIYRLPPSAPAGER